MGKHKELTIGLLISGITDNFTISVCNGAISAAAEAGVRLVIFPGKYLDRDFSECPEILYEYQYNMVFSFARQEMLDAVLISANTIGCFTSLERIRELLEQYTDIPCVLIASKIDGYVSVNFDNSSGIKEAVDYLVRELNCTKIGMIGGPDDNSDAFERKTAFIQSLNEHGLSLPDKRYTEGNFSRYQHNVFRTFLSQNPDIEAVFCANDDTAIGLYDVLKEQNISPGTQLYVFGYDNITYAANMKPALSSVWADPVKLGKISLEMVCQMLQGQEVQSKILTTRFIKRDSLGTHHSRYMKSTDNKLDGNNIDAIFDDIFYRYPREKDETRYRQIKESFTLLMDSLLSVYHYASPDDSSVQQALDLCDFLTDHNVLEYADIEKFIDYIEEMNLVTNQTHSDTSSAIYRKLIHAMKQQYGEKATSQAGKQYSIMLFVKDIMSFQDGNDQSYTVLLNHLDWLRIKNAAIYVYDKPVIHLYREKFHLPDKLYLKAVLKNGNVESIPAISQETDFFKIYSNPYIGRTDSPQVLFPLFSGEAIYGVLLCDMTDTLSENGDFFVNQMSSAVKMIHLLKNNHAIQQQLEDSLAKLKENNIVLDTLSKYDALTGIFNRRGFFDAAEKYLNENRNRHTDTIVAYIDMNNLKIINDRYGHDEGDYSIRIIGEVLGKVSEGTGIVGRIGGDEFALITTPCKEDDIVQKIYDQFEAFNRDSIKNYQITVAAGVYTITPDAPVTLSDALSHADVMLYKEKAEFRKRNLKR